MNSRTALRCVVALGLFMACVVSAPSEAQTPVATQKYDIVAQNLSDALVELGRRTGRNVLFAPGVVAGKRSAAVRGASSFEQALQLMLKGTGLAFSVGADGAATIASATTAAPKSSQVVISAARPQDAEQVTITGLRPKPFTDANVDLPRTQDDVQPYVILDSQLIDQSGALNVEDFLKQRLTMNTAPRTNAQQNPLASGYGTTSSIDLRGLGANKTLVLVNGRRMAGVSVRGDEATQFDLNGLPLSAIDRIEVLPTSASGIYGGSAIGGVVNVILKSHYIGGEVRTSYENTMDGASPSRAIAASYGLAFEGGRSHFMLSTSWSDGESLLLRDRRQLVESGLLSILNNSPDFLLDAFLPPLGAVPNITAFGEPLVLKNGTALGSDITHVSAGISPTSAGAELYAGLQANAGQWNLDLPEATQEDPFALRRPFGSTPTTRSIMASVRRQMSPTLAMYLDYAHNENRSTSIYNPVSTTIDVPAGAPVNPFTSFVTITVPSALATPYRTESTSDGLSAGLHLHLPGEWTGLVDYSHSRSRFDYSRYGINTRALRAGVSAGTVNPFVDLQRYPIDYDPYLIRISARGHNTLGDFSLRGFGPIWDLPWGTPALAIGLEHRVAERAPNSVSEIGNAPGTVNLVTTYFARKQISDSGYLEVQLPLIAKQRFPLLHSLELQVAGRQERFEVDGGTQAISVASTGDVSYIGPTRSGEAFTARSSYKSTNFTAGLKYQPVAGLALRASTATAFLPPAPSQLVRNPLPNSSLSNITDPRSGLRYGVQIIGGGNPDLEPQNARSFNAGVIWEPEWQPLRGMRLNAEYYRIQQFDAIGSLTPQTIVDNEDAYPERVSRDAAGRIALVDSTLLNLYRRETSGWDFAAGYQLETALGSFDLQASASTISHLRDQYSLTLPEYDSVGFPSESGAAKYKSGATLTWKRGRATVGWATRYFGAYKQFGAEGGPNATQRRARDPNAELLTTYTDAQGGSSVPSQMYHDLFASYRFGQEGREDQIEKRVARSLLDGLSVRIGIKNAFDEQPPLDVFYDYYLSPYGDTRLRSYWLSVEKGF